jgi:membrane protein insertase Oxa1/YidC/SpoIIIJ
MIFGMYSMIDNLCSYGGPYIGPFLAPLINPLAWFTWIVLAIAIYTGNNKWLSDTQGKKSYKKATMSAFRINYVFHFLITFFLMKSTCGMKDELEAQAMNYVA